MVPALRHSFRGAGSEDLTPSERSSAGISQPSKMPTSNATPQSTRGSASSSSPRLRISPLGWGSTPPLRRLEPRHRPHQVPLMRLRPLSPIPMQKLPAPPLLYPVADPSCGRVPRRGPAANPVPPPVRLDDSQGPARVPPSRPGTLRRPRSTAGQGPRTGHHLLLTTSSGDSLTATVCPPRRTPGSYGSRWDPSGR